MRKIEANWTEADMRQAEAMADLHNEREEALERLEAALQRAREAKCTCEPPALRALRGLAGGPPRHNASNPTCEETKACDELADVIEETGLDVVDLEQAAR